MNSRIDDDDDDYDDDDKDDGDNYDDDGNYDGAEEQDPVFKKKSIKPAVNCLSLFCERLDETKHQGTPAFSEISLATTLSILPGVP